MNDIAFRVAELPKTVKSSTDNYIITICIPTYSRLNDLKKCLDPLLERYGNSTEIEIVVIDNGSSDGTSTYLLEQNIYTNTSFFIRESNAGFDINVLDCFYKAKGQYVHFLGDDDILLIEAFDDLIVTIKKEMPDLVFSNYTVKTSKKTYNVSKKQTDKFTKIESIFSYVGHYLTFMSSITLRKQPAALMSMNKYINFKFMHISLLLETLSGKNAKLIYSNKPIAIATDINPAAYNVADIFLNDLIHSFRLNSKDLDFKKLEPFFVSVIRHCIGSNIGILRLLFNNDITNLVGFKILLNFDIAITLLRRIIRNFTIT